MDTKNPRAGSSARVSVSIRADTETLTKNLIAPQPASVHQLRALRLMTSHNVRPSLALALATLCFGEARNG